MWLKEELKLDISPEKSKITDITVEFTEFLGFKIKAIPKRNKWVGTSFIADKARERIYKTLAKQISVMGKQVDMNCMHKEIVKYNAMVMGIHNYYKIATGIHISLNRMSLTLLRKLYTKTKHKGFSKQASQVAISIPQSYIGTEQIRYVCEFPVLPIGYCQTKNAVQHKIIPNPYAEENEHKLVAMQISKMWSSKFSWSNSIAFVVNYISRYAAQKGKCAITNRFLLLDEAEGHDINPKYKGGTDDYQNIMVLSPEAHLLIRVTDFQIINNLLKELKLNKKQLSKLNELRKIYGTEEI